MSSNTAVLKRMAKQVEAFDEAESRRRVEELEAEKARIQQEIDAELEMVAHMQALRKLLLGATSATAGHEHPTETAADLARTLGPGAPQGTDKRLAIRSVMGRDRNKAWSPKEVTAILADEGFPVDRGAPIRNVMWKMGDAGQLRKLGDGLYGLPENNGHARSTALTFAEQTAVTE